MDEDKRSQQTKPRREGSGRASNNDKRIISPSSGDAESGHKTEKTQKKRALKRNVNTTTAQSQIPAKQVKQATVDQSTTQSAKQESQSSDGPSTADVAAVEAPEPETQTESAKQNLPPATPPKATKLNTDACSLSDLESPVASLVFSQSTDTPTTTTTTISLDEGESEDTSATQQSQESVQNSQEESALTDDFDSDYNKNNKQMDTELEDSDDCPERMNARLCVERDVNQGKRLR